jgi:hypothetical protein
MMMVMVMVMMMMMTMMMMMMRRRRMRMRMIVGFLYFTQIVAGYVWVIRDDQQWDDR